MRIVALGRSELLFSAILHLAHEGHEVSDIITGKANPEYRCSEEDFAQLASQVGAEIHHVNQQHDLPSVLNPIAVDGSYLVSCNWRYIIPPLTLKRFGGRALNLHLGNLPDYKGNATVNWSILDGLDHIDANVHVMEEQLDEGAIYSTESLPIGEQTYVGDVLSAAEAVAGPLFSQALRMASCGVDPTVQSSTGLRCYPRLPEDGQIDWSAPAQEVVKLVRASSRPFSGAFTFMASQLFSIWRAHCLPDRPLRAVPGHILRADSETGYLEVACGSGVVQITEWSNSMSPALISPRGIRSRFHSQFSPSIFQSS